MYSGDEQYGDDITSGLTERQPRPVYPSHGCGPLGTVVCKGCGFPVDVIYPYSNSKSVIGIKDHADPKMLRPTDPPGWYPRCADAGKTLVLDGQWLGAAGYTPEEVSFLVPLADVPGASE